MPLEYVLTLREAASVRPTRSRSSGTRARGAP